MTKALITGAAGRVGRVLTRELEPDHDLLLGDIQPLDDPRFVPLDVTSADQVQAAVARAEAVIHLAIANRTPETETSSWAYAHAAIQVQVLGTHHVLRAAAEQGRKRVLYASSISAVQGYPAPCVGNGRVVFVVRPVPVGQPLQGVRQLVAQTLTLKELPLVKGGAVAQRELGKKVIAAQLDCLGQQGNAVRAHSVSRMPVCRALCQQLARRHRPRWRGHGGCGRWALRYCRAAR